MTTSLRRTYTASPPWNTASRICASFSSADSARTVAWYDADPRRRVLDTEACALWDRLIAAYERGLEAAAAEFRALRAPGP